MRADSLALGARFGSCPPSRIEVVRPPGSIGVASSLPGDLDYSPLWLVSVYDNSAFPAVHNESTLLASPIVARDVATVNCPIVFVERAATVR